jgi:dTDP-4-amino-4,6-dideoxygalactose transaminase
MIPYVDLQAQYQALKPEIDAAVLAVLDKAQFILGPAVAAFEKDFAAYCRTTEAIGVNSGTSALHLALLAAGVGPGDEVITVPYTFVATVAAIEYAGAKPVFVDVEPGYWTMDPAQIARAITPRTKAIIPVHLYGQPADMDPILDVAQRHGLKVIEDACQSHGSEYKGRRCGSMGDLGCFSFYPGKNLGAYGEGGAVVTNDAAMAEKIRLLRAWGEEVRYEHKYRAFNYRMDGVQGTTPARPPMERPGSRHVYHIYAVQLPDRDAWRARFTEAGVQTGVHYPIPVHLQPAYRDLGYARGDFPVSEAIAGEVLSLPMFPELTSEQIGEVAGVIRAGLPAASRN